MNKVEFIVLIIIKIFSSALNLSLLIMEQQNKTIKTEKKKAIWTFTNANKLQTATAKKKYWIEKWQMKYCRNPTIFHLSMADTFKRF